MLMYLFVCVCVVGGCVRVRCFCCIHEVFLGSAVACSFPFWFNVCDCVSIVLHCLKGGGGF